MLLTLGRRELRCGRLVAADRLLARAAGVAGAGADAAQRIEALVAAGDVARARGDLDRAEGLLQRALVTARDALDGDSLTVALVLNSLGVLFKTRGELDRGALGLEELA